ncbi:MAG: 4'-phosphopantetheinyl transferase superfamily protein [Clostridiales bacterium]|nr:4'-phosphopantetheinyl transferase superfamily protein [Clostridiales bacterium]MCD8154157.1 4'-phosphopantetheinyl transferase superfamily protein [Clostridiales bacterium]
MKGVLYYTEIREEYKEKRLEHMIGEKLLERGLKREYGLTLAYEPRAKGEHGKPFFTLQPWLHYNISHSGKYVVCLFADREVGIDVQQHKASNYARVLGRTVPEALAAEILGKEDPTEAFFTQWVMREAFIKWTGEGLSRDLRTIPMDSGSCVLLDLDPGYSGAVWAAEPVELRWEYEDITL